MATIALTTVGGVIGGPAGRLFGAVAGSAMDGAVTGRGPRQVDLNAVTNQSSAYGSPIPLIYGRMRAGGTVLWATPLRRTRAPSASMGVAAIYSVSLAIALSGRPIERLGRIWADGRLVRSEDGTWSLPVTARVHTGRQTRPDPLVSAALGADAPQWRGLAYVVLEDLPLTQFGNRLPQLTFDVHADGDGIDAAEVAIDLAHRAGLSAVNLCPPAPIAGYWAGDAIGADVARAAALANAHICGSGPNHALRPRHQEAGAAAVPTDEVVRGRDGALGISKRLAAAAGRADEAQVRYFDPERDLQPAVQRWRASQNGPAKTVEESVPAALSASAAQTYARQMIRDQSTNDVTASFRLPLRWASIELGDVIDFGTPQRWRVAAKTVADGSVLLEAERDASTRSTPAPGATARIVPNSIAVQPSVEVLVLVPPPLPFEEGTTPRLLCGVLGDAEVFQRADIWVSLDHGETYAFAGTVGTTMTAGLCTTVLGSGPTEGWDDTTILDIQHVSGDAFENRSAASVLAGANLAAVGDELIRFRSAMPVEGGRLRISGLLRGCHGTQGTVGAHLPGERIVLLSSAAFVRLPVSGPVAGTRVRLKAVTPAYTLARTAWTETTIQPMGGVG
ncbi:MAG: phage tail protein [Sphingomonadaceae bacterium]|nr:phage tail protein [Sphingomonadaceae bacterium]